MAFERFRGSARRRTLGLRDLLPLLALLLLLLILAPALARAQGADSLTLHWTAPGDDGTAGIAQRYDVRVATFALGSDNFFSGTALPAPPNPLRAGSLQTMVARGLRRGTPYWFAVRTQDAAGNWSAISNVLAWAWPLDYGPPAAPTGVAANVREDGKLVRVTWRAGAESDLAGYLIYRSNSPDGPWQRLNTTTLPYAEYDDAYLPDGARKLWYQVSAADRAGNESARSPAVVAVVTSTFGSQPTAWKLHEPYPNPARLGEIVRIPIEVPVRTGGATLDILDGAGERVRQLEINGGSTGLVEVTWDGLNEMGRRCAPGLYRAWLTSAGVRQYVRIGWVP